jgi:hypothetical protein
MTYELVLAVVPPDESDPIGRAYELLDPFFHTEDCRHSTWEGEDGYQVLPGECMWDGAKVADRYHFSGRLWHDRYGHVPPDHPVNGPEDEVRRAGDINMRLLFLHPTAMVTPDGHIYYMGDKRHASCTTAQYATYEDRLAEYPDHLVVPMACHS